MNIQTNHQPILVVGSGPTGLTLALNLAQHGIAVRIIDQELYPHPESRALALHSRSLEILERLGALDKILQEGRKITHINVFVAGQKKLTVDISVLKAPYPFVIVLPQNQIEHILLEKLYQHDVKVERGKKLLSSQNCGDHVEVDVVCADGNHEHIIAPWLIGCDGAHSAVRHAIKADFKGFQYPFNLVVADINMEASFELDGLNVFIKEKGSTFIFPIKENFYRIAGQYQEGEVTKPITLNKIEQVILSRCTGSYQAFDMTWSSEFKVSHRKASKYRWGRQIIAGDAAHIHSPIGGQGMNTGIQDAYNLGWKLAYVMQKQASTKLIASYSKERMPIAKKVLSMTNKATKLMIQEHKSTVHIYGHFLSWVDKIASFKRKMAYQVSQLAVHYRKSPIVHKRWKCLLSSHKIHAGDRFADGELIQLQTNEIKRMFELLAYQEHTLFIFVHKKHLEKGRALKQEIEERLSSWIKVCVISLSQESESDLWCDVQRKNAKQYGRSSLSAVLVRPDGYIASIYKKISFKKLENYLKLLGISIFVKNDSKPTLQ